MERGKKTQTTGKPSKSEVHNKNDTSLALGTAIRDARGRKKLSQSQVAEIVGLDAGASIGQYERGEAVPGAAMIIRLAQELDADPRRWLLYAYLQQLEKTVAGASETSVEVVRSMLGGLDDGIQLQTLPGPQGYYSLTRFPQAFSPLTVVVGDRREEVPKNLGDLFAFSASCVDDRWLSELRLPPGTEKISDKVFLFQEPWALEWRKKAFGKRHLMVIGSPAANLLSRDINRSCLFRFAVPPEAERLWAEIKDKEFPKLKSPDALESFRNSNRELVRGLMRKFQQPGFVAYDVTAEDAEGSPPVMTVASIIADNHQDFGVISLGRNPYAEPGEKFFTVFVAGIHYPATAWAIRFLANPRNFEKHPFGGIIEVWFPSRDHNPDDVKWYESVGLGSATWHTVGKSALEYEPDSLRRTLARCLEAKLITSVPVDQQELEDHQRLIDLLTEDESSAAESDTLDFAANLGRSGGSDDRSANVSSS